MKRRFRNLPLRAKMVLLMMFISCTVLGLSSGVYLLTEVTREKQEMTDGLLALADVLSANSRAAVVFGDEVAAARILTSLRSNRDVVAAYLADREGRVLARFAHYPGIATAEMIRNVSDLCPQCAVAAGADYCDDGSFLYLKRPVVLDKETVGYVYLKASLEQVRSRLFAFAAASAGIFLLSGLVALLLASWLQRLVSQPLQLLLRAMDQVSRGEERTAPLPGERGDELGELLAGFNAMLAQIGERDRRLEVANATLEQRVEERTWELQREVEDRRRAEKQLKIFSDAIEQSSDGINITDLQGNIVYCNEASSLIYGYAREELIGRNVEIFNVEPTQTRTKIIPGIHRSGSWAGELMQLRQDGARFQASLSASKIVDAAGQAIGMLGIVRDITESKHAEESLRALEKALDTTTVGITITDLQGRIVYANPAEARMHGYAVGELLGQMANILAPLSLHQPYDRARARTWFRESINQHRDGHHFPVQLISDLVLDAEGRPLAVVTVCEDISERKRVETALRESETKFRSLFENSPVSLWEEDFSQVRAYFDQLRVEGVTDLAAHFAAHPEAVWECARRIRVVDVNRATLNLFRAASREEMFGNLDKVFSVESYGQFVAELVALANGANSFETEGVNRTLDGELLFVSLRLSVAPGCEQTLERVIVSLVDFTERRRMEEALRESEERFRQMVDLLPQPVFEADAQGRVTFANRAGFETFGYTPQSLAQGLRVTDTILPREREEAMPNLLRVFSGEQIGPVERTMLCPNGRTFPALIYVAPIVRDGQPAGIRGLIIDITGRKRTEEQLRRSLLEKEVLVREVHHRVKNNLQIISSLLNLQLSNAASDGVRAQLGTVRDRVRSMALIHEQLYRSSDLSRINFALYLEEFVHQMCRLHGINPAKIALRLEVEEALLDVEIAIPCALIVNELLTNAFKYAFPGERRGEVAVRLAAEVGQYRLSVADDGIGLSGREGPGSGATLGLQLVKSLVDQLGGEMFVERDGGTRTVISFPGRGGARMPETGSES